nr:hypothetical protein BaRGS_021118 [Batillaria attramentaria]
MGHLNRHQGTSQAGQGDVIGMVDKLPSDLATMALVESKRALAGSHIRKLEREVLDAQAHFNSMRSQVKAAFDGLHQMVEKRRQEINTKLQEEENSVVTPKQDRKASLEEQRVSVAAHAGSVERLVVPSPDSVLLGMVEKLRTRLDDLEKQTQLSPDSQDVRLASFTFDSDMVKRFEEAFGVFGVVTAKGGTASGTAVGGNKKCLVCGHDESSKY